MPKLLCQKTQSHRLPHGTDVIIVLDDSKWWHRIEYFKKMVLDLKIPRNLVLLNKFWALMDMVVQNTDDIFANKDHARDAISVMAGQVDVFYNSEGEAVCTPKRINFSDMEEDEFEEYYNSMVQAIITHVLVGMDKEDLEREIAQF
tara:strand:- start:315 stop:752 length:438 start_codon:yes stop_codon:yes gene_type:complete